MRRASQSCKRLISVSTAEVSCAFESNTSSSSLLSLQSVPESQSKPLSNPLYSFLPENRNPNNLVNLICSALKQGRSQLQILQEDSDGLIPHLGNDEISRVLLRCQSDSSKALAFFDWVRRDLGIKPTPQNYCLMLHILGWSKNYPSAMQLVCELIEFVKDRSHEQDEQDDVFQILLLATDACNWKPVIFDVLVRGYLKLGMVKEGFRNFMKTVEVGFVLNVITCNHLLNGLLKLNRTDLCWKVYNVVGEVEIHPNTHTFNIMTNVFCRDETDLSKVNDFLEKMEEEGFEPDLVTYNTLISSYSSKGRLNDAFYLYKIMYRRGVVPDLFSYKALIKGLCKESRMKEAHQLFNRMIHRGLKPDAILYNTLIYGYFKEGRVDEMKFLLFEMIGNGVSPDGFTCKIVVEGYVREGRLITVLNLVNELRRYGVIVCNEIYDYIIVSLCREGKPFAAKNLMDRVSQDGYTGKLEIYGAVIESLCKVGSLSDALSIKDEIADRNMKPNLDTYRTLICSLCRHRRNTEAELLFEEMLVSNAIPDPEICRALVNGYCEESDIHRAETLLEHFAKEFRIFDTESYNTLIKTICEASDVSKSLDLQDRLRKVGFVPNSLTCKYVIQGLCKGAK